MERGPKSSQVRLTSFRSHSSSLLTQHCIGLQDYFGVVKNNRLVFTMSAADVDESLEVRSSLLRKHPNVTLHANMLNAHLYIFKRWVIDLVAEQKGISSLQGELIPFLVNSQWRSSAKYSSQCPFSTPLLYRVIADTFGSLWRRGGRYGARKLRRGGRLAVMLWSQEGARSERCVQARWILCAGQHTSSIR